MILYEISYSNPLSHWIDITITISEINSSSLELQLPSWRPGRYEIQNFAKNVQSPSFSTQEGESLVSELLTKDRWQVDTSEASAIKVHYRYYAFQMDAGGSVLNEQQLYINFINCLMYVEGRTQEVHEVKFYLPPNYQIACGLKKIGLHHLEAQGYDELVDSPMIASSQLHHRIYQVHEIDFHVWVQGNFGISWDKLLEDFKKFTQAQIEMFGDFPEKEYHFLIQLLPYRFYHGVEHRNSTIICLGPDYELFDAALYNELLGISSHELFHAWNVCKIRPVEMMPYDYTQENYFLTGFVIEGITTYYGDLFLLRSGIWTLEQWLGEFNKTIKKYFSNFGRLYASLADSSWNIWLDGYQPNSTPDRKVSIYHAGSIVALLLDLQLRLTSKLSLDDVMRVLWHRFGKQAEGYRLEDFNEIIESLAGLSYFIEDYITGLVPIETQLATFLENFGMRLVQDKAHSVLDYFGFSVQQQNNGWFVGLIVPGSPAANVLSLHDEIIAIDGRKLECHPEKLFRHKKSLEVTLFRQKSLKTVTLTADDTIVLKSFVIELFQEPFDNRKENLRAWSGA